MKKNYLFLAAAATMFTACVQSDLVSEIPQETPQAIGFETFANKQTRAENNQTEYKWALQDHHLNFTVFAGKLIGDPKVSPITQAVYSNDDNGTVSYSSSAWTASPLKYWDKTATEYYFYAGAPADEKWEFAMKTDGDYSTGYLTYNNFTLNGENLADGTNTYYENWSKDNTKNDVDLMVAAPNTVKRSDYNKPTPENVHMQFNHILSRLSIKVKKGSEIASTQDLKLTSLVVYNMKNSGNFDESVEDADQTPKIARWTTNVGTYELPAVEVTGKITDPIYTHQYLVIPQAVKFEDIDTNGTGENKEAYFRIDYTIDGEAYYAYYNLAKAFGQNVSLNFQEGWANTLTITINPNAIAFDANVSSWQDYVGNGSTTID